jgi:glycosyltransferase involved in cell wall biosynthesis
LYRLLRRLAPDIVHNVTIKPVLYGTLAARLAGVPRVINAVSGLGHLFSEGRPGVRWLGTLLYRSLMRHSDMRVILQNRDDYAYFKTYRIASPESLRLIRGSGVDTSTFVPGPEQSGPPVVMQTSRMIGDKGVLEFIAAARLIKQRRPDVRFLLVGPLYPDNPTALTGEELDALTQEGVIEWLGNRNDVSQLLQQTTVYVLASTYKEGVPKALIEAAACARPIVTTDISGCREVVTDSETGLLVPPRNAAALAQAIERLLTDAEFASALGVKARERVLNEFALDMILDQQIGLYREPALRRSQH